ncbi:MAG: 2-oxo acid dehydrogenase subunit E2 [Bacillus subtilis]|nr:2-oxo acid dehydrogenase subunit E2 [Bacillus subtilis]
MEERPKSVTVVGVLPEGQGDPCSAGRAGPRQGTGGEARDGDRLGTGWEHHEGRRHGCVPKIRKTEDRFGPTERVPVTGLRRIIARNLLASQKMTAFVTAMDEADVSDLWSLRDREKAALDEKGVHLTVLPFSLKALQHALVEFPVLNASVDEQKEEIIVQKYYHFGIAVDTLEGLIVPVIRDVDKKSILDLARELQDLSVKSRGRKISLDEIRGSTFTITNYGLFGGTFGTPIINYPDVAVLGIGRITDGPWVKDGQIMIRKVVPLSLTFDHRITDGGYAARFLTRSSAISRIRPCSSSRVHELPRSLLPAQVDCADRRRSPWRSSSAASC